MSQRGSGYARKANECYETPEWVTDALIPHIPKRINQIHEPASGSGKMSRVLGQYPYIVTVGDVTSGCDFLGDQTPRQAIITNPPYNMACEFIWQGLVVTRDTSGFVAMLLRTDFDHAKTRMHLFDRAQFSKKLVLTKRIRWIEGSTGSPSFNHAWFCWDWKHDGPPALAYHYERI